jgi:phasin family protein
VKPIVSVAPALPEPEDVVAAPAPAAKVEAKKVETPKAAPKPVATKKVETKPVVAKAAPVKRYAPAAISPETKGVSVMATTVPTKPKAAAEKVKDMISDFNDRAKAAFEKSAKAGEELTEFTKGNMEALAVSAKTAAKGAESLGQEIADYSKKSFETATATMKSMASVKTPTELFQLQSDYAKTSFDSAVAEASKLSEAWLKLAGDVFQPLSSRYAIAAEKIKSAAL